MLIVHLWLRGLAGGQREGVLSHLAQINQTNAAVLSHGSGEQQRGRWRHLNRKATHSLTAPDCLFKTCFTGLHALLCSAWRNKLQIATSSKVVWKVWNGHLDLLPCDSFQTTWDKKAVGWELGLDFLYLWPDSDFSPSSGVSSHPLTLMCAWLWVDLQLETRLMR